MAWQSCSSICREDNVEFDYIRSPVTSGGGQPYNPCGFVTDIYIDIYIYRYIYIRKNFIVLLRENGLIFFQNYFYSGSVYMRRVRKCTVDGRSASGGAWQGHAHF